MGLLDRLKARVIQGIGTNNTTVPTNNDDDDTTTLRSQILRALATADQNPVVCSCLRWITLQASSTPYFLQKVEEDEDIETFLRHALLTLLVKPNPFLSGTELLKLSIVDMWLRGQCFWFKDRQRNGAVNRLTYLPAKTVTVKGSRTDLITEYEYRPNGTVGGYVVYQPEQIVHIRIQPDPDDPKNGQSPLYCLARDLLINNESKEFTLTTLTGKGSPGGLLTPPGDTVLTPEVAKDTRDYIKREFRGMRRGEIGVLRANMQYLRTALSPGDLLLRELEDISEELICAVFGIHPVVLGLGSGSTQSRVGAATVELERASWANGVIPLQDTIAEQIGRQLLGEFIEEEELEDWAVAFDRSGVLSLQPDQLKEAQRLSMLVKGGIIPRSRALEELHEDVEESDKVYLLPSGVTLVPIGEMPPEPAPVVEPVATPTDEDNPEAEEDPDPDGLEAARSAVSEMVKSLALTKAVLNDTQRALLLALAADADYPGGCSSAPTLTVRSRTWDAVRWTPSGPWKQGRVLTP